jgi:hypothetical protein
MAIREKRLAVDLVADHAGKGVRRVNPGGFDMRKLHALFTMNSSPSRMSKKYRVITTANVEIAEAFLTDVLRHLNRARYQSIRWYPSRVPSFHGLATDCAFKAADLSCRSHGLGAVINRPASARPMTRLYHLLTMRPESI